MKDGGSSTMSARGRVRRQMARLRADWRAGTGTIDQAEVVARIRNDSDWTARFAFMTVMSAGIAILGLLQNSVAVIIGAMLVAPLMGPIMALGFAIATADFAWMKESVTTLLGGMLIALGLCVLIVLLSPLQTVTSEIAARTEPTLFDLAVALFSALAGAYAIIRGKEGTIIGVAIATALMPPLAVVAFGLATQRWDVFGGALLLFFTNFMTIALACAIMARLYGFSSSLSPDQTRWQSLVIAVAFATLAVPLALSLRQIAWEAAAQRQASEAIRATFGEASQISDLALAFDRDPVRVHATVFTSTPRAGAEAAIAARLTRALDQPTEVVIDQYRVGTADDGDASAIAEGRLREAAARAQGENAEVSGALALLAGVPADAVTVDTQKRRAVVSARVLPGASLVTYRALEARLAATHADWDVRLVPPLVPLPAVAMAGDAVADDSAAAAATARWAARRTGRAIRVGPGTGQDGLIAWLAGEGVAARGDDTLARRGEGLTLDWSVTDEPTGLD